jgi:hypothetical protein
MLRAVWIKRVGLNRPSDSDATVVYADCKEKRRAMAGYRNALEKG